MEELHHLAPFIFLFDGENELELYFDADERYEIFEDYDQNHSAAIWVDLIELFLEENLPDLLGAFEYEPDYDRFVLRGECEDVRQFALAFHPIFHDDGELGALIEAL